MFQMCVMLSAVMAVAMIWPELPFSRALTALLARLAGKLTARASTGRALIAIGVTVMIFAAVWALQGDAPMALAMVLPEMAAWFATFEIATLVEAAVALGSAFVGLRASGLGAAIKARSRSPRPHRVTKKVGKSANDDEPGGWALAA